MTDPTPARAPGAVTLGDEPYPQRWLALAVIAMTVLLVILDATIVGAHPGHEGGPARRRRRRPHGLSHPSPVPRAAQVGVRSVKSGQRPRAAIALRRAL